MQQDFQNVLCQIVSTTSSVCKKFTATIRNQSSPVCRLDHRSKPADSDKKQPGQESVYIDISMNLFKLWSTSNFCTWNFALIAALKKWIQFGAPKVLNCCFLCQVWPPKRMYNMWTICLEAHRNKNNILAANKKEEYHQPKVEIAPFIKCVQHLCSPGKVRESRRQICANNLWVTCLNFGETVYFQVFATALKVALRRIAGTAENWGFYFPVNCLTEALSMFHGDVLFK